MKKHFFSVLAMAMLLFCFGGEVSANLVVSLDFGAGQGTTVYTTPAPFTEADPDQLPWVPLVYLSVENTGDDVSSFLFWGADISGEGSLTIRSSARYFEFNTEVFLQPGETVWTPVIEFAGANNYTANAGGYPPAQEGEFINLQSMSVEYSINLGSLIIISEAATQGEFLRRGEIMGESSPAPVPEPATMLLFGTGLASLGWLRRKKK
ncbi:MAG: hypothetical protein UR66_C0018G0006 [Candidatus Moranbacteria bacterium GW2011_GWE1_35_17]|nr:MAG: hypothetical protein UR66_C0018G0006 [Candidatus Moranbacteria bacterium GW2011_GWE1_35_17]KKP67290.1 MAG: hypothetical protein UR65_C0073G0001 [Candidatus Moranbacteria bacterium GW2011_GWE2_35_164]KKP81193.1 MAG: hypothetical protein UR82_C0070G0006 [Candidatus Moranbacteria bacterium GW2011_GWF1_35_5]KKP83531.1 MAG: hypothetical protein UR83_C0035G0008 [Candidatus Moranbacteria bacterium GW2011_GWF2_35_54]